MSEVQSRPAPRGRSSARGGRGGHGARGPRTNAKSNGDNAASSSIDSSADQGELGELKKRYLSQLTTLKELFPDWTDVDLLLAIEETNGDLPATIERITEGNVSQFAEVKKKHDRSRSKVKENVMPAADAGSGSTRGPRPSRGHDSVRGGRGRGTDRGRGGFRGSRGGAANGTRSTGPTSTATVESPVWDNVAAAAEAKESSAEEAAAAQTPAVEAPKAAPPAPAAQPAVKTWASMFAKPKPAPAVPKPVVKSPPKPEEPAPVEAEKVEPEVVPEAVVEAEELPIPPVTDEVPDGVEPPTEIASEKPLDEASIDIEITPSKDELTRDNVEHLPDESHPPPTETAASTVASSRDIGSAVATPLSSAAQAPIGRPAPGGFATTALKATSGGHRSHSFQRKLMEQQEAVVMPGNHAVDRAAVQFGSLGLNGDVVDASDVDEDREEAETRPQPPQHSPVAQPRASLPPAPRQVPQPVEAPSQETMPTPKQAPGLPPAPQQQQPISSHQESPQAPLGPQAMQSQGSQGANQYSQFARYGQGAVQSEQAAPQKAYDPFGQSAPQSNAFDYANPQQTQGQPQPPTQSLSSAPDAFGSQYYTSDHRSAYQQYYQNYNQSNPAQQEAGTTQQRTGSAFGSAPNDSAFPQSQPQQAANRYNDAQNSGHNTPNPPVGGQPTGPASQAQHIPHGPGHAGGGYPGYNPSYYPGPYYSGQYMNQFNSYGQGYGGFGKGMYGQPHHYGMSPQTSYDQHSSSPANVSGFGQSSIHGRDTLGSSLGDYGRTGSQPSQSQHSGAAGTGFGSLPDVFTRSQAGYPGQTSTYGQQQSGPQGAGEESLKPFGESKTAGGPSPSALAQPGRPGSAANNTPGQTAQSTLPPPQSHQQGFGGYPSHLNQLQGGQGNQYGGLGGLGHQGAGSHQTGGYGAGYGGFGGYGNSYSRGGWGTNYGQH